MRLIDPDHPFFRPAWRRYLVVVAPLAWAVVEWRAGSPLWAALFAASGCYLAWFLILTWRSGSR